ncbi:hypothetical protein HAX54_017712 [Datura stramonium]|uniref:Uncharacterized protein n=1 Tax=Datura stramonium TaxID=4076 RepID=A0ABS8S0U6_DATST|nr:hypothetical protein [Datura stramonium]
MSEAVLDKRSGGKQFQYSNDGLHEKKEMTRCSEDISNSTDLKLKCFQRYTPISQRGAANSIAPSLGAADDFVRTAAHFYSITPLIELTVILLTDENMEPLLCLTGQEYNK